MTEPGDKLAKHYRDLAREEPPAALDAAILAASRRSVGRPSLSRRWAMPVSIAAVLVLAFGVTLQMQREDPGVEVSDRLAQIPGADSQDPYSVSAVPTPPALTQSAPERERAIASAPAPAQAPPAPKKAPASPKPGARDEQASMARRLDTAVPAETFAQRPEPKAFADSAAPARDAVGSSRLAAASPGSAPAAAPAEARSAAAPPAAPPPPARANAPQSLEKSVAEPPEYATRDKRESANALQAQVRAKAPTTEPERELERIARLRAEGRHEEADKALTEFRRKYPEHRIAEAVWERVKPR